MRLCSGATKRPPIVLPIEARRSAAHSTITYGAEVYPAKLEHGVVLAPVKVWTGYGGSSFAVRATANLDGVCARRRGLPMPEWKTA